MRTGHYLVRPTSKESRTELMRFLEEQGFTYRDDTNHISTISSPYPIIIDIIPKTIYHIQSTTCAAAAVPNLITENEFYDTFNVQ